MRFTQRITLSFPEKLFSIPVNGGHKAVIDYLSRRSSSCSHRNINHGSIFWGWRWLEG